MQVTENLIVDGMPQQRKFRQTVILSGLAADTDTPAQQKAQKISKLSLHVNLLIFAAASPQTWLAHHFLATVPCRPCVIVVCA